MPRLTERQITLIGRALAEPRRRRMLQAVAAAEGRLACSTLARKQKVSAATVSHHVKELENAGLISVDREGKFAYLTLRRETLASYIHELSKI
jgi:ArsR family transcriptional regulator